MSVRPEGGLILRGRLVSVGPRDQPAPITLLIRREGEAPPDSPIIAALGTIPYDVISVDLRAIGRGKPPGGAVHGATDHNEAEWGLWIGRPLLGQWVRDALAWIDAFSSVDIVGEGPFGLVGLIAAALRPGRVSRVGLINPLVSFVGPDATPWSGLPMGLIAPGLLETADVGGLAALVAPSRLVVAGAVEPGGGPASPDRLAEGFAFARSVYGLLGAADRLTMIGSPDLAGFVRAFSS